MGLAPYGSPTYIDIIEDIFYDNKAKRVTIADIDIFSTKLISKKLEHKLGFPPRSQNSTNIQQKYANLASSIQLFLEKQVVKIIKNYLQENNIKSCPTLYLSGGVALNCKLNYVLSTEFNSVFSEIWAFPASGDSGSSIGACFNYLKTLKPALKTNEGQSLLNSMLLGSSYKSVQNAILNSSLDAHDFIIKSENGDIILNKI